MSLNHLASKNLHGNFASLKVNDVTIGGSGKQHIHFSANLNSNGVNFLNAFSKGSWRKCRSCITSISSSRKHQNHRIICE
jgi:hypothetical protein